MPNCLIKLQGRSMHKKNMQVIIVDKKKKDVATILEMICAINKNLAAKPVAQLAVSLRDLRRARSAISIGVIKK